MSTLRRSHHRSALPCVLVSPDSLARFFPARPDFSTSWCSTRRRRSGWPMRSAPWAGPLRRRRRRQQADAADVLRRTARSRGDERRGGAVAERVEDEECILTECVQARVPRHWLSWHYRSQDESLIAFSNRHYYEGRLVVLPGAAAGSRPGSGTVSLGPRRRALPPVGRGASSRTNPVEAEAIVDEIRRRFDASPMAAPSIGVVTFNAAAARPTSRSCSRQR